jgi:anthranilate synthase/aminodeoxychorismate synthase-like glutamine amidotransferase
MILFIDNYDSFSFNLIDIFRQLNVELMIMHPDDPWLLEQSLAFRGIIISPGPGNPEDYPQMKPFMTRYMNTIPIFGVCLGMQMLGHHLGASIEQAKQPMHGKVSEIRHNGSPMFAGIPETLRITRYHSLVLQDIPEQLIATAYSNESGEVMGISHASYPVSGVQFHPEAHLTEYGLQLIQNWVHQNKILS